MTIDFSTTTSSGSGTTLITPSDVYTELGISVPTATEVAVVAQAIIRAVGEIKKYLRYDPVRGTRTEFYPQMDYSQGAREAIWEVSETEAYQRFLSEASTNTLFVKHLPIRSITSLYIDYDARNGSRSGAFAAGSLKVEGTDFWPNYDGIDSSGNKICCDGVIRSMGRWPTVAGSVKITYVAGYSTSELDGSDSVINASPIKDAAIVEAALRARKVFITSKNSRVGHLPGPLTSENLGDYSYTADSSSIAKLFGASAGSLLYETQQRLQEFVNFGWGLAS